MTVHHAPAIRSERPTARFPRWFLRAPELLFRFGLDRFVPTLVMLEVTGRRTGRRRRVVLDVAHRDPEGGLWVIAGDGLQARWVMNLLADPRVRVHHRGRRWEGRATVTIADAAELAVEMYHDRPTYTRLVYGVVGVPVRDDQDVRRISADNVAVLISPAGASDSGT